MASVLHNFLDTLSSRHSDHDGYWIFGFLVADLSRSTIDLLTDNPVGSGSTSWTAFVAMARTRFAEQARLNSVARFLRSAVLSIERRSARSGMVNGHPQSGFLVELSVTVTTDLGRTYDRKASLFVAPHDPSIEHRSVRREEEAATQPG